MPDHQPNKCYYKPKRLKDRPFTARDAGRIICYAQRSGGATRDEIVRAAQDRGCWPAESDCEKLRQNVRTALELATAILAALLIPQSAVVRALVLLARFLPAGLLGRIPLLKLLQELPVHRAQLEKILEMLRIP